MSIVFSLDWVILIWCELVSFFYNLSSKIYFWLIVSWDIYMLCYCITSYFICIVLSELYFCYVKSKWYSSFIISVHWISLIVGGRHFLSQFIVSSVICTGFHRLYVVLGRHFLSQFIVSSVICITLNLIMFRTK